MLANFARVTYIYFQTNKRLQNSKKLTILIFTMRTKNIRKKEKRSILSGLKERFTFEKPKIKTTQVLISGILLTCIILSIVSGFIDLVFFSNLSKSLYGLFGLWSVPAGVLMSIMSIGFTSGKFFVQMQLGAIKELQSRLRASGFVWSAENLNADKWKWGLVHKFLVSISIITSISLSVISIGTAVRDAERNSANITIAINELTELKDQQRTDTQDKKALTRSNIAGTANSKAKAEEEAERAMPNIYAWQSRLVEIDAMDISSAEKTVLKNKERPEYTKKAPTFVTSRNIDYISKVEVVNGFKELAQNSETDNAGIEALEKLNDESRKDIRSTILALEKRFKEPDTVEKGIHIDGSYVTFIDENGEPLDISQVIGKLQTLRDEWKNSSDIGDSAELFMLISEIITSKTGNTSTSGAGTTEIMLMVLICIFGIVQEFLIALFTPKSTIDRKMLSRFSGSLEWKDEAEKETFLIKVYKAYVGDGILSKDEYERKVQKCVELMDDTVEDTIARYSKKN